MIDPRAPDFSTTPGSAACPSCAYRPCVGGRVGISIVTAVDGPGDTLHELARCVLGQSFQHWEWLVVGAAGIDSGLRASRELDDPRIGFVALPAGKRGRAAARNAGCLAAQAAYLCILDGEDLIEPTFLEKSLWHLATHPEFAFANAWSVRPDARPPLSTRGFEERERFFDEQLVAGPFVVRRGAHVQAGGFPETSEDGPEDRTYWWRHAEHGAWGSTIPEYLTWHRRRGPHADAGAAERELRSSGVTRRPRAPDARVPRIDPRPPGPYATVTVTSPVDNPLGKPPGVRRVLLIFPRFVVGGADKFTIDLVARLTARGNEVTVCTTLGDDNPWLPRVAHATPDVFPLPTFLRRPDYPRFLLYLIDSRQIDVVLISHSDLGYQLVPFLRAHRPEVACVDYSHIEAPDWNNGGYPRAAVGCHELLDLSLVSTRHLKDWMVKRGAQEARIQVVHTNIDTDAWKPNAPVTTAVRSELGFGAELPVILYAARLTARKQPHVFAEVIRRLAEDEGRSFGCVVAGDGDELPALRRFVVEHRLDARVRLLGWVSPERMRDLQAAADIFFLPSRHEGLSMALFEAMAMETVPVSAAVGGQDELVTPACGILVEVGDTEIDRYVEALRGLIDSRPLRAAMGAAARRRVVESFGLEAMGERMCDALTRAEQLCATDPRPRVSRGLGVESATLAVERARLEACVFRLAHANEAPAAGTPLSAHEISRQVGTRTIVRALWLRLASRFWPVTREGDARR